MAKERPCYECHKPINMEEDYAVLWLTENGISVAFLHMECSELPKYTKEDIRSFENIKKEP